MHKLSASGCMAGHQDDLAYGVFWEYEPGRSDFLEVTGREPAVFGWDVAGIEHGNAFNIDSVPFQNIRQYIIDVYDKGGINTISWHMDNILTGGNAWDVSSKEVVRSVLEEGDKHEMFKQCLDAFAAFNATLKGSDGKQIPVIFRPWHELTGSWFWWGKDLCSPEDFIRLWKFTHRYLSEVKAVDNLLYAYSTSADFLTKEEFMERYPGDDFVDIIGFDNYQGTGENDREKFKETTRRGISIVSAVASEKSKVWALTEVGCGGLPDSVWFTSVLEPLLKNVKCSYALFWRNANDRVYKNHYFIPYQGHPAAGDFRKFVSDGNILTREDTGNIYK